MASNIEKVEYLITSALLNRDSSQQQSQSQLLSFRAQNPEQYIYLCSLIVTNQGKKDNIRLAAGTLMSAAIILRHKDQHKFMWNFVNTQLKKQIKDNLLETLVSPSEVAKRSAASTIAAIASIELPCQEWEEVLPVLINIIHGQNIEQMKTAVMTLGYINAQLAKVGTIPSHAHSQMILAGILVGLQRAETDPQIKSNVKNTLLNSLKDSMSFVVNLLQNQQAKQHIIKSIFYGINDHQTTQSALQTLEELIKYAYPSIKQNISHFHKSLNDVVNRNNQQSIAAIEIWNVMGKQYLERKDKFKQQDNPDYLTDIATYLCDILLAQITLENVESQHIQASIQTLETLVVISEGVLFNKITYFASTALNDQNKNIRKSAVLVFSSLVQTKSQLDKVLQYFERGFAAFLQILDDTNSDVIKFSLQGWYRIFNRQQFRTSFFQKNNCESNVNQFLKHALQKNQSYQIQYLAINTVYSLFQNQHIYQKSETDNFVFNLLKSLTDYSFEIKVNHLQTIGFCCIIKVLVASQHSKINEYYVQHLIDRILQIGDFDLNLVHSVMDIVSVGIKKSRSMKPDIEFMKKVFKFVVDHITYTQQIHQSSIDIISSLAYSYKRCFEQYCEASEKYLLVGLVSYQDVKLCQASLGCLSDIAYNIPNYLKRNFHRYMDLLMKALNEEIYRELKIKFLDTIGDCIASVGVLANPYLPTILETIRICYSVASEPVQQNEYIEQLRISLMKLEDNILLTFGEQGYQNEMYKQHFLMTIKFGLLTTEQQFNPRVTYLQDVLEVLLFGAKQFGYMHMIDTPQFDAKIRVLEKFVGTQNCDIQMLMVIKLELENYRRLQNR